MALRSVFSDPNPLGSHVPLLSRKAEVTQRETNFLILGAFGQLESNCHSNKSNVVSPNPDNDRPYKWNDLFQQTRAMIHLSL